MNNLDNTINKIKIYQIISLLIVIVYIINLNNYRIPLIFNNPIFRAIILLILVFILKFDLLLGLFFGIGILLSITMANQKIKRHKKEKNWNLISNCSYDDNNIINNNNYFFSPDEEDILQVNNKPQLFEKSISKNYSTN